MRGIEGMYTHALFVQSIQPEGMSVPQSELFSAEYTHVMVSVQQTGKVPVVFINNQLK